MQGKDIVVSISAIPTWMHYKIYTSIAYLVFIPYRFKSGSLFVFMRPPHYDPTLSLPSLMQESGPSFGTIVV